MKTKNIFTLIGLGIITWFFLKPKKALAEEVAPPKQVLLGQTREYAFPGPGIYVARLTLLEPVIAKPTVTPVEIPKEEEIKVRDIADIMEAIVERSRVSL